MMMHDEEEPHPGAVPVSTSVCGSGCNVHDIQQLQQPAVAASSSEQQPLAAATAAADEKRKDATVSRGVA